MSKLLKLKEWVSLGDAARYISVICEEDVKESDVVLLGLDGHLQLSIQLVNGAYACPCVPVNIDEIEWKEIASLDGKRTIKIPVNGAVWQDVSGTFQKAKMVTELASGIWDLPLTGGERIDIEFMYQQLTGGPEVTAVTLDGMYVTAKNGDLYELQSHYKDNPYFKKEDLKEPFKNPDNFHPAGALPTDSVVVVRTKALADFEKKIRESNNEVVPAEKDLGSRERSTFLKIISALCASQGLDLKQPYKAAEVIKHTIELSGGSMSLETIAGKLEQARQS